MQIVPLFSRVWIPIFSHVWTLVSLLRDDTPHLPNGRLERVEFAVHVVDLTRLEFVEVFAAPVDRSLVQYRKNDRHLGLLRPVSALRLLPLMLLLPLLLLTLVLISSKFLIFLLNSYYSQSYS